MKTIIPLIFVVAFLSFNCKNNNPTETSSQEVEETKVETDSVKRNYYLKVFNGVVQDTVFYDSSLTMALIVNPVIFDNKFYLVYSKFSVKYSKGTEIDRVYNGHFFNSYDLENLPSKKGELFRVEKIISSDNEFELGDCCSFDTNVIIERIKNFPDSDSVLYIKARVHECSDIYNYKIIEKQNENFVTLFEFRSTDSLVKLNMIDSSIVECKHYLITEDIYEEETIQFDLKTKEFIEN